ncbi:MAG TPA: hypothetical protein VLR52_01275, partial [Bacteroidales bacterium]|nr:hypothetical protein [Bacteroidales bacterium]
MDSKSLGFFFLFLVISLFTRGQDLIVTEKGDSLNCLISSVESDGIYFKRNVNGKMERWYAKRDTLISFSRKYYATAYLKGKQNVANDFQKYRFGLMGGGSLQTGRNLSFSGMSAYLDKVQYGYHFGAEGTYFFTNNIGFGLRYSFFHIESFVKDVTLTVQTTDKTKTSITGDLQDKISVNFIGPEFILRINSPQNRVHYNTTFAFGLITYRNKSELKTPAKLSGAS